jgi:hypothetical protein
LIVSLKKDRFIAQFGAFLADSRPPKPQIGFWESSQLDFCRPAPIGVTARS